MDNVIESVFVGRLGSDAELRTSAGGKPWLKFSAVVGSGDSAQWVQVAAFGSQAEDLAGTLKKGDRAYVEGRLTLSEWTDRAGNQHAGLNVAAWRVEKLGAIGRNKPKKAKTPPEGDHPAPLSTEQPRRAAFDDGIPF